MIILIEMRGLPSLYDQRFVRCRFWLFLTPLCPFWPYLGIFELFRSSESYEICEKLIMTFVIKMMGLPFFTTKGSWNIDLGSIGPLFVPYDHFWSILTPFGPFCLYLGIFVHFQSSEKYKIDTKQSLKHDICDWNEGSAMFIRPKVREI